jgi:glycosyltransferase involved in cell wall biosynthesis
MRSVTTDQATTERTVQIWGWAADHNGCGQYRIGLPMWALGRAGHDTLAFSRLDAELPADLDVLVGQRVCEPDRARVWLELAARADRRFAMVFELDDDLWNVHATNHGAASFRHAAVQATIDRCIAAADAVTVTTPQLADIVRTRNPQVHVLPNCVDEALLHHRRPRTERVTIGWAGGSSHRNDFDFVRNDLRTVLRRNPAVDMHFIGVNYGASVGRPDARYTAWNTNLVDYLHTLDFDIGIAPLAYHVFNRSKSDLKVLEYAALGIPVVASDYGPYPDSIQHGVTGFLVKRDHEWGKYLRELVNDEGLRTELGENARRWAATRTVQANSSRWEAAYAAALAGRRAPAPA